MGAPDPAGSPPAPNTGVLTFGDTTYQMSVLSCGRYPTKATLETAGGDDVLFIAGQTYATSGPQFLIQFDPQAGGIWQFQGDAFSWAESWNDGETYWHGTLTGFGNETMASTISLGC